jgi:hypothetical protein
MIFLTSPSRTARLIFGHPALDDAGSWAASIGGRVMTAAKEDGARGRQGAMPITAPRRKDCVKS